ncbi:hypothetical protein [Paenibacillus crassostreae]|uniref:hypothetical protein n=1 Tax=Paenibacillus crassostreae TaxID=1763538 RepID=UPI000B25CB52|nr:hypothetical protein [Paenibacillus crassostreae]
MKHYDFLPDEHMDPVIGLLHSMVVYNYQRLSSLVDGLTQCVHALKGDLSRSQK